MHPAPLAVMDYVGPALGALVFVVVMSLVAEPTRRTLNAIILAGASGVYLSGGFGLWELIYPVIGDADRFSWPTFVPVDRCRLADSRRLGYRYITCGAIPSGRSCRALRSAA